VAPLSRAECEPEGDGASEGLDELIGKIEAGQDLTPHLSGKVSTAHDPRLSGKEDAPTG
jgi:hypothetical protein